MHPDCRRYDPGTLIEALPKQARRHWDDAKARNFSIGIDAATEPGASDFAVSAETVARAARLSAGIIKRCTRR